MLELADRHDLGSCAARRVGSSPTVPITHQVNGPAMALYSQIDRSTKLKFEKTIQDDHQAQIVVEVEADKLDAARHRAARKLAGRGKIPGFRPGKAPYDVILRYYGDAAVYEEAVDLLVDELYPEVLKEADVNPAAAGMLEKIEGTDTPKLTFKVPLSPEVSLGKYEDIRLPYDFKAPTAEDLDKALEELRQAYATTETVERAIQEGDYVLADLKSELPALTRDGFATVVHSAEHEDEYPFPGFSQHLLGLKAGDSAQVKYTFSGDHQDATLSGQTAELSANVKAVRTMILPEVDAEFAKTVGGYESVDALKEAVAKDLEVRARADHDDGYFTQLVDMVSEGSVVKYAPQTLNHEAEHVVEDMRQRLARQRLDLETYYKLRKTDAAKFLEEEAKPVAKKRLGRSLILDEVARKEKIEVDSTALDAEFNNTLVDLQSRGVNFNAIRGGKQGQQRIAEALAMQSANRLLMRRTLERLKGIATGEYHPEPEAAAAEQAAEGVSEPAAGRAPRKSAAAAASKKSKPGAKPKSKTSKATGKK